MLSECAYIVKYNFLLIFVVEVLDELKIIYVVCFIHVLKILKYLLDQQEC